MFLTRSPRAWKLFQDFSLHTKLLHDEYHSVRKVHSIPKYPKHEFTHVCIYWSCCSLIFSLLSVKVWRLERSTSFFGFTFSIFISYFFSFTAIFYEFFQINLPPKLGSLFIIVRYEQCGDIPLNYCGDLLSWALKIIPYKFLDLQSTKIIVSRWMKMR